MKEFTESQVDDLIKLKFGDLVTSADHTSYVPNRVLGKLFGVSGTKIRELYMDRFEKLDRRRRPLLQRLRQMQQEPPRKRWGIRFLQPHMIRWLTSPGTLRRQTSLSLGDRCQHFLRHFPHAHINPTLLRKVYRQHGIRKKKYRWTKVIKNLGADQIVQQKARMKRQLTMARHGGYRIIYLDETVFTRKTVPETEWTLPRQNVTVDQDLLKEPCLALLSGISKERGQEHYKLFPRSVNIDKFKVYLAELRARNGEERICLFMDQLSVHTSDRAKKAMKELGFRWCYNVAYSPEWNPIESVFSLNKRRFRALRAKKLTGLIQDSHEALVHRAVRDVRKQDIVNCVNHVIKLLR